MTSIGYSGMSIEFFLADMALVAAYAIDPCRVLCREQSRCRCQHHSRLRRTVPLAGIALTLATDVLFNSRRKTFVAFLKFALYGAAAVLGATLLGCKHSPPPPEPKHLTVAFATTELGTTREEVVTVTGITGDISISSLPSLPAPYSIVDDGCSNTNVTPADGCNFAIRFSPTAEGSSSYSFDLPWNADHAMTVHMSGNGVATSDGGSSGVDGDQDFDLFGTSSGAAYVFTRSRTPWNQTTYIKASNTDIGERFGSNVALCTDGNTLAVAAPGEDSSATDINGDQNDDSATDGGAVYTFTQAAGTWRQQGYIKASNTQAADGFGDALALSGNGEVRAVSAQWEHSNAPGVNGNQNDNSATNSGAVYVFTQRDRQWSQQSYIKATIPGIQDEFGSSVVLNSDGTTLAVGAHKADGKAVDSGAVCIYERDARWQEATYLTAPDAQAGDAFSGAVALNDDGLIRAVGASREDDSGLGVGGDLTDNNAVDSGAVCMFTSAGVTRYVKAGNTRDVRDRFGNPDGERFGFYGAVALSGSGLTLAVGAP